MIEDFELLRSRLWELAYRLEENDEDFETMTSVIWFYSEQKFFIEDMIGIVSERVKQRQEAVKNCWSERSRKHMQIRTDEAGQIVALLRAALGEKKDGRSYF